MHTFAWNKTFNLGMAMIEVANIRILRLDLYWFTGLIFISILLLNNLINEI